MRKSLGLVVLAAWEETEAKEVRAVMLVTATEFAVMPPTDLKVPKGIKDREVQGGPKAHIDPSVFDSETQRLETAVSLMS